MRNRMAVVLSAFAGLLALVLMWVYIHGREVQLLEMSGMKSVWVATADIRENTVLDETMVGPALIPAKYVQPKAVMDVRELLGRVAVVPVSKGAQLQSSFLQDAGQGSLAIEVPRGQRALTLAVSDVSGVAGLIRPGNFVDVFGVFEYGRPVAGGAQSVRQQYTDEKTDARLLMQDLQVIAVEREHLRQTPEPPPETGAVATAQQRASIEQRQTQRIANVTVLVDPQQAQELVLAQQVGTLTLALRSNLDAGKVVDLGPLDPLGLLKVPIPVKARSTPVWREIRGIGAPSGF